MEAASRRKTPLSSSHGSHSRRTRGRRRPLSDCTNTVVSPSSSSASTPKPPPKTNPWSSSGTARIGSKDGDAKTPSSDSVRRASAHSSSTPESHDANDLSEVEPLTVYTRRRTAEKRRIKGKAIAVSASCSPVKGFRLVRDKLIEERDGYLSKSCPLPITKRQKSKPPESGKESNALEDYIRQQKSYFAEVDAFELPEEEVVPGEESD
ncbi:hypothetical protein CRG98_039021 [Punica granatum]|uniref:Sororin C-terminal region domain-containing protein n=1 Tax=Punica granatum TaxID=22663 RepID=A0A2I0I9G0_PUNGR|nr:hypothetical protein CRG98_039021 [Punica granatum]